MWPFEYPYTNFHELNLDWILNEIRKIPSYVQEAASNIQISSKQTAVNLYVAGMDNTGAKPSDDVWKNTVKPGGIYYVPPGTYSFVSEIPCPENVVIIGAGAENTIFMCNNHGIWTRYVHDVTIIGITVKNATNRGFFFRDSDHIFIDNCKVENMRYEDRAYQFNFVNCHDIAVTNCHVNSAARNSDGLNLSDDAYNVFVYNFSGLANDDFIAINPGSDPGRDNYKMDNITIINANAEQGCYTGCRLLAPVNGYIHNLKMVNCNLYSLTQNCIYTTRSDDDGSPIDLTASFENCAFTNSNENSYALNVRTTKNVSFKNCSFTAKSNLIRAKNASMEGCTISSNDENGGLRVNCDDFTFENGCINNHTGYNAFLIEGNTKRVTINNAYTETLSRIIRGVTKTSASIFSTSLTYEFNENDETTVFAVNATPGTAPSPQAFTTVKALPTKAKVGSSCIFNGEAYIAKTKNVWTKILT